MSNTSVIRVKNSSKQNEFEDMTLCTEFLDSRIRILILRNNFPPVLGEVKTSELWDIAQNTFPESEENFYKETRNVLSGKETDFDFSLEDETFEWRKGIWTRGFIKICPIFEITVFSDLIQTFLINFGNVKENFQKVQTENDVLKTNMALLQERLQDMIYMKESIENSLYTKFILILNTKKRKIRELQEEIKVIKKKLENSVYDQSTDVESMDEEDERRPDLKVNKEKTTEIGEDRKKSDSKGTNRIGLEDKNNVWSDSSKINRESETIMKDDILNPKPSTSKQNEEIFNEIVISSPLNVSQKSSSTDGFEVTGFEELINSVINVQPTASKRDAELSSEKISSSPAKIPRKTLDDMESDDEDFELKDEGDSFEKAKNTLTYLNITDEEPEKDLFSQSF